MSVQEHAGEKARADSARVVPTNVTTSVARQKAQRRWRLVQNDGQVVECWIARLPKRNRRTLYEVRVTGAGATDRRALRRTALSAYRLADDILLAFLTMSGRRFAREL